MRVVSLIASATEILWAMGKGHLQVGRSHECDHPESVLSLPQTTWTKFDTNGRSYEIDQRVKAIVQEGLSVYGVDADMLKELQPDVIITQDHCQVCAVSLDDVESASCQLLESQPVIVSLHPDSLADIWNDIRSVAAALNDREAGEQLIENMTGRIRAIETQLESTPRRPSVVFIEWIEPLMVGGNWAPELIQHAGALDLLGTAGSHSPQLPFSALTEADPEYIIIAPCGYTLSQTRQQLDPLLQQPEWNQLQAVRSGKVYLADGNRFFNRPGPSVIDSLEILAEILHPEHFSFGYRSQWWQPIGN